MFMLTTLLYYTKVREEIMTLSRNDRYRLTNRERDILDILWESGKSMVASEITSMRDDLSINTVQAVLKKLLQKKLVVWIGVCIF